MDQLRATLDARRSSLPRSNLKLTKNQQQRLSTTDTSKVEQVSVTSSSPRRLRLHRVSDLRSELLRRPTHSFPSNQRLLLEGEEESEETLEMEVERGWVEGLRCRGVERKWWEV